MFAAVHGTSPELPLRDWAESFSPAVEEESPETILFDIRPLGRLYGGPHAVAEAIARHAAGSGMDVNVAVAPNPEMAILAARCLPGIHVLPNGEAGALAALPIRHLPLEDQLHDTLRRWGIHTFGDLSRLPEAGLAERLGPEGVRLRRLAQGALTRPLRLKKQALSYADRLVLEDPVSLLEPLLFLIARLLNPICALLESQALATNEITLLLELEKRSGHERVLHLPVPMRDPKQLLKLLQLDLEAHPPNAATIAIALHCEPVPPRRIQSGLFLPLAPEPDKLELTLARIRALVGEQNTGVPELLDTHHPEPFRLQAGASPALGNLPCEEPADRGIAFRFFRPVLSANVQLDRNRPVRVQASGVAGAVTAAAGPWRSSGYWWRRDSWTRSEWDVALSDGGVYRIYCEPGPHWFIEGSYD